jgi:hypothetical protein
VSDELTHAVPGAQAPDAPRKERIKRPKINPCPECDQENYRIWPGYGKCQTCFGLRMAFLDQCFGSSPQQGPT